MQNKKSMDVRTIVAIGLMAALVFIFSKFRIDIPSPLGKTGIHFGNIMCLLGGLLFGAVPGGLAAGIGSALLDLTDPVYAPEFWITFLTKFAMGFVAGWLGRQAALQGRRVMVWVAAAAGSLTYVVLYGLKNILMGHFVQGFTWAAAIGETMTLKVPVSVGNGIIAVICAALLAMALAPSLHKAHLLEQ
ncbi:MAG TPA: ECF transporter S component [Candidatus Anaerofilum excrementigallinarum]|nr:ECF transporter S component [Candidatus Anaerofilum excrementigallinarum]